MTCGGLIHYLGGQRLTFDQPPVAMNNRTLVPLRAIFEGLGATADWNVEKHTILATRGETAIMLELGVPSMAKQVGNGAIQYLTNNQSKMVFLQSPGATKPGASSFGNSSVYIMDLNGNNVVEIINNGESGTDSSDSGSSNSTPQPTTCTICASKGWVTCSVCHGNEASVSGGNCLFCSGGGLRQCPACHGSGTLYPHV